MNAESESCRMPATSPGREYFPLPCRYLFPYFADYSPFRSELEKYYHIIVYHDDCRNFIKIKLFLCTKELTSVLTNNSNHFSCGHVLRAFCFLTATIVPIQHVQYSLRVLLLFLLADIAGHKQSRPRFRHTLRKKCTV